MRLIDLVKANLHKNWSWYGLSMNPNITWQDVQNNPELPWSWEQLSLHPELKWDFVKKHPVKPWDWNIYLSNRKYPVRD